MSDCGLVSQWSFIRSEESFISTSSEKALDEMKQAECSWFAAAVLHSFQAVFWRVFSSATPS